MRIIPHLIDRFFTAALIGLCLVVCAPAQADWPEILKKDLAMWGEAVMMSGARTP